MAEEFDDRTVWVIISTEMAKLLTCNSSGKTVFWETQEEASAYAGRAGDGYECEFYLSEENQDNMIAADQVNNISKYG
jgi:hypothetical protein